MGRRQEPEAPSLKVNPTASPHSPDKSGVGTSPGSTPAFRIDAWCPTCYIWVILMLARGYLKIKHTVREGFEPLTHMCMLSYLRIFFDIYAFAMHYLAGHIGTQRPNSSRDLSNFPDFVSGCQLNRGKTERAFLT
jgi:hypothetical protein